MNNPFINARIAVAVLGLSMLPTVGTAQILTNGSFENGLTGWTAGGTNRSDSLTGANFSTPIVPTDGTRVALLSTGAGNVPGGGAVDVDANGVDDFDQTTLSQTATVNLFPLAIRFDWSFPSAEEDQPDNFDDIFEVNLTTVIGGTSQTTRALSGSANKPGGASPFPDAPAGPGGAVTVNAGGANGSNYRFGIPAFTAACIVIPGWQPGNNDLTVQFTAADQGDSSFDSGLIVDNVRLTPGCGDPGTAVLDQITNSVSTQLEVKGGGLVARPASNSVVASSLDGAVITFIGRADYDGSNPNFLDQVFTFANGSFTRITAFTGDDVQSVDISPSGRYLTFAGRQNDGDNLEIFRYDRNTSALTQITTTTNCDNTSPSINDNGRRIAFLSTCGTELGAGFNPDGSREMVFWNNGNFLLNDTIGCQAFAPEVSGNGTGRYASFASSCDYAGNNGDGNIEVFRFDRNNGSFIQISDTTGLAILDSAGISRTGRYTVYVDTDIGGNRVVMRYDANSGNSTFVGVSSIDPIITAQPIENDDGEDISIERLDLISGEFVVSHVDVTTGIETEVARGLSTQGTAIGLDGGVPVVHFIAAADLVGNNADQNTEVFRGRVNQ